MKRLPPLNDASPPEHWEAKAKELGLSVESLREQVRLADEAMEEILREESSSHAWRIPDFGDQIRSGFEARDFKAWFIFTAMSHLPPYEDIVKKFFSADGSIPGAVEIELRVNGQLVNAEAAFKELESSFNRDRKSVV